MVYLRLSHIWEIVSIYTTNLRNSGYLHPINQSILIHSQLHGGEQYILCNVDSVRVGVTYAGDTLLSSHLVTYRAVVLPGS